MFQFVLAASVALSSESIDGVFSKRPLSCSGGSCSASSKPVEAAKPKSTEAATSPKSYSCGKKKSIRSNFRLFR
jgi:hypothetical protein